MEESQLSQSLVLGIIKKGQIQVWTVFLVLIEAEPTTKYNTFLPQTLSTRHCSCSASSPARLLFTLASKLSSNPASSCKYFLVDHFFDLAVILTRMLHLHTFTWKSALCFLLLLLCILLDIHSNLRTKHKGMKKEAVRTVALQSTCTKGKKTRIS